jgi:hypothetical protein
MRPLLLLGLFALYVLCVGGALVVTYQNHTARKPRAFIDADAGLQVAGGAEESEPSSDADNPAPYNGLDAHYEPSDPPLKRLLHCSAKHDRRHTTRFFTALSAVFLQNKAPLTDFEPGWGIDEGYAVSVNDGLKNYIAVVLRGWDHIIPGDDTQYLFLLGADGKILDRMSCAVNSRLTREVVAKGSFRTALVRKRESDGTDLIVRYSPPNGESISGNWAHTIVCRGYVRSYPWNEEPPNDFEKKGLCRVAIREGKFVVLFPA